MKKSTATAKITGFFKPTPCQPPPESSVTRVGEHSIDGLDGESSQGGGDVEGEKEEPDSTNVPNKKLKLDIHSKPTQPIMNSYLKDHNGRSFQAQWYRRFDWLEYNNAENKAYCFACRNFSTHLTKSEPAFSVNGYNNWSNALIKSKGFYKHSLAPDHTLAVQRWKDKLEVAEGKRLSVINQVDPDRMSVVMENREYIKMLLKYHIYFVKNELGYRGHDETEDSLSPGKWKDFINLQLETNPQFHHLHSHIQKQQKNCDYISKRSCNEMIQVLSEAVGSKIVEDINQTKMYCLMIDESKDNAGHEELSLCVQYVKNYTTQERFLSLRRVDKADAHTLVDNHIMPHIEEMGLVAELLGGGADGASVMSGGYEGVFALMKTHFPWLVYIHCAAHRNNLVVTSYLFALPEAVKVITVYKSLHTVFNVANNREIFEKHQAELYPNEQKMGVTALTEVRWGCQFEGVSTILARIKALLASLIEIAASTSNTADKAAGLYHKILSADFITSLVFLHEILAIMHGFSTALQKETINWVSAKSELETCKALLAQLSVEEVTEKVCSVCLDVGITPEYEDPIHATRSKRRVSDYFRVEPADGRITISGKVKKLIEISTNKLLKDLEHRFQSLSTPLFTSLLSLDAASKEKFLDFNTMLPILKQYQSRIPVNKTLLEVECKRAKVMCETGGSIDPELYPNIQTVIQVHNTLPVSTASVERGFSCMNRIITYARNSLLSTLASHFVRLSLNKDILVTLDLDKAVDDWAHKRSKRFIPLR